MEGIVKEADSYTIEARTAEETIEADSDMDGVGCRGMRIGRGMWIVL